MEPIRLKRAVMVQYEFKAGSLHDIPAFPQGKPAKGKPAPQTDVRDPWS